MRRYGYGLTALVLAAIGALILIARQSDGNFVRYAALLAAIVLVPLIAGTRNTRFANILLSIATLLVVFAPLDLVAARLLERFNRTEIVEAGGGSGFIVRDPKLGYAPRPSGRRRAKVINGRSVIYDVTYDIDAFGFRGTNSAPSPKADTVVFLGNSFTYGEGLNDDQTLPQQYADDAGPGVKVINAGFSGYGTHQVLRLIQSGRLDGQLGAGRRLFVYTAIKEHLQRNEGRGTWDFWGPRYVPSGDGVRDAGQFHSPLGGEVVALAATSGIVALIRNRFFSAPSARAPRLFGAMVKAAQDEAARRDHARMVVVLWDEPFLWDPSQPTLAARQAGLVERMAEEMSRRGVPYLRISSLIPDYRANRAAYVIALDGHPSALLNQKLAQALIRRLGPAGERLQSSSKSDR